MQKYMPALQRSQDPSIFDTIEQEIVWTSWHPLYSSTHRHIASSEDASGLFSFFWSICLFFTKVSFWWPFSGLTFTPLSMSLSSGHIPSNRIKLMFFYFWLFWSCRSASINFTVYVNSRVGFVVSCIFSLGRRMWQNISVTFSATNGIDQLNTSMKLGSR